MWTELYAYLHFTDFLKSIRDLLDVYNVYNVYNVYKYKSNYFASNQRELRNIEDLFHGCLSESL